MRKLASAILAVAVALAAGGCIQHEGQLAAYLTYDAPDSQQSMLGLQQVSVEVTQVDVQSAEDGAFRTIMRGSLSLELLRLGSDRWALLALGQGLEEGTYQAIRITFSSEGSSVINDAGRRHDLRIEPEQVIVPVHFQIVEDATSDVLLDFAVDASLALKANGNYVMRPVITQISTDSRFF
jgi:hypothetical protein